VVGVGGVLLRMSEIETEVSVSCRMSPQQWRNPRREGMDAGRRRRRRRRSCCRVFGVTARVIQSVEIGQMQRLLRRMLRMLRMLRVGVETRRMAGDYRSSGSRIT